jgi:ubiquinone/menaquinone biosynthesis C-methylase UbiE
MLDKGEYDTLENKPIIVCDINPDMLSVGKDRAPGAVGSTNANMVSIKIACLSQVKNNCYYKF